MTCGDTRSKLAFKVDLERPVAHLKGARRFNQVTLFLVQAEGSFPQHF